jgi:hypothetical protein
MYVMTPKTSEQALGQTMATKMRPEVIQIPTAA